VSKAVFKMNALMGGVVDLKSWLNLRSLRLKEIPEGEPGVYVFHRGL